MISYLLCQIGKGASYVSILVVQAPLTTLHLSSASLEERLVERKKNKYKRNKYKSNSTREIRSLHLGEKFVQERAGTGPVKGKTLKLLKSGPPEEEARIHQEWLSRVAQG